MCKSKCLLNGIPNLSYNNIVNEFLKSMEAYLNFQKDEIIEIKEKDKWFEAQIIDIDFESLEYLIRLDRKILKISINNDISMGKKDIHIPKWRAPQLVNIGDFLEYFDYAYNTWTHCKIIWKKENIEKIGIIFFIENQHMTQLVSLNDYKRLAPLNTYLGKPSNLIFI